MMQWFLEENPTSDRYLVVQPILPQLVTVMDDAERLYDCGGYFELVTFPESTTREEKAGIKS